MYLNSCACFNHGPFKLNWLHLYFFWNLFCLKWLNIIKVLGGKSLWPLTISTPKWGPHDPTVHTRLLSPLILNIQYSRVSGTICLPWSPGRGALLICLPLCLFFPLYLFAELETDNSIMIFLLIPSNRWTSETSHLWPFILASLVTRRFSVQFIWSRI